MKRTVDASLGFIEESVETKPSFGKNVVTEVTANATSFPALPVAVGDLDALNTLLAQTLARARTGDHEAIAAKMNAEKAWNQAFRSTAKYVSSLASGNEEIIRKGGFVPTKSETSPTQPPAMPAGFEVNPVKASGKASVESKVLAGTGGNVIMAKTEGIEAQFVNDGVIFHIGNQRVYIFADTHADKMIQGLEGNVRVAVSMFSFNRAGVGPATDWQMVTPQ